MSDNYVISGVSLNSAIIYTILSDACRISVDMGVHWVVKCDQRCQLFVPVIP